MENVGERTWAYSGSDSDRQILIYNCHYLFKKKLAQDSRYGIILLCLINLLIKGDTVMDQ